MVKAESQTTRSWHVTVYLLLFSMAGLGLAATFLFRYFRQLSAAQGLFQQAVEFAVLVIMLSLCRSFPLPTRKGQGTDISIILLYATIVLKGLDVTVLAILVSAFFTFDRRDSKNVSHIFNTPITKTLFNNANYILSVSAGWLAFTAIGGRVGELDDLLRLLLPSLMFLVVTLLVNSINIFTILKLTVGIPYLSSLIGAVTGMLPTLLAFAPIGYFLALIFTLTNGPYLTVLFFVPLMFARYSFKLYIDSKEQYLRTISTLTAAIEAKDEYTEGHSKRVAQVAVDIAHAMGMGGTRIENIKVAAVLHDIGKIGIDDEILRKPSKLTDEEWAKIIQHPSIGIKILEEVVMPEAVKEIILYHHIRFDGKGYPQIEPGRHVAMEVYVVSLADAYDAMTSDRPYRKALAEETAVDIIRQERAKQFHPDAVDAFLRIKQINHRSEQ